MKKNVYNDNSIPKGVGVSYPCTPDGYINMSIKYSPMMGTQAGQILEQDTQLMKPFTSLGVGHIPTIRSGKIERPHDEEATYFYSTQKALRDDRWPSPWDHVCKGDTKYYTNLPPYKKPPHQRKRNPMIGSVPYIPKAQILSENAGINLYQRDSPFQVQLGDLDIDTYGRDRTIDITKLNTMPRERIRYMEARLRNANTKNARDSIMRIIKSGGYDQDEFPHGMTGVPPTFNGKLYSTNPADQELYKRKPVFKRGRGKERKLFPSNPFNIDQKRIANNKMSSKLDELLKRTDPGRNQLAESHGSFTST